MMSTPPLLDDAARQECGCKIGSRPVWAEKVDRDMHSMHYEPSVDGAQVRESLRLRPMDPDVPPLTVASAPPPSKVAGELVRFHNQAPLISLAQCSK